jgi:hypothetical protein
MPHIVKAAAQAVATCQSVFADRRWNCTSIETAPSFTPDITTGRVQFLHLEICGVRKRGKAKEKRSLGYLFYGTKCQ